MMTEARSSPPRVWPAAAGHWVDHGLEAAERKLSDGREDLKAARRRVVQLEDVVGSWKGFASEVQGTAPR